MLSCVLDGASCGRCALPGNQRSTTGTSHSTITSQIKHQGSDQLGSCGESHPLAIERDARELERLLQSGNRQHELCFRDQKTGPTALQADDELRDGFMEVPRGLPRSRAEGLPCGMDICHVAVRCV